MPDPTFTAPPTAPSRSDAPATFVSRADAFVAWFSTFRGELVTGVGWISDQVDTIAGQAASITTAVTNGLADIASSLSDALDDIATALSNANATIDARVVAAGWSATSSTSNSIGTGSKTFTVQTNKAFVAGAFLFIADSANPTTKWMFGQVTSYNVSTGELVMGITETLGSGTVTAWTLQLSGRTGQQGPLPTKATGADIRDGDDDAKYVTAKALMDAAEAVASSVSGSTTLDFSTGLNFALTLTGNLTLNVPSNMENGQSGVIYFIQDGTGSRTLSLNASIKKPGAAPTLSTPAGTVDRVGYFVRGGVLELTALEKGIA